MDNNNQNKIILNPVLGLPWKKQRQTCENPSLGLTAVRKNNEKSVDSVKTPSEAQKKRNENIESLLTRFPGLKKYQARAALTMSDNKLEKAIILLEVSKCFSKDAVKRKSVSTSLKNIQVNLWYDVEPQDPTPMTVMCQSSLGSNKENSSEGREDNVTKISVNSNCSSRRVGVVIARINGGYKATPL